MTKRLSLPTVLAEAYQLLDSIVCRDQADASRSLIAEALVYVAPEAARVMLDDIRLPFHKYRVMVSLFAASADPEDYASVLTFIDLMRAMGEDVELEEAQLAEVVSRHETGWRASPERVLSDKAIDSRRIEQSKKRVQKMPLVQENPSIFLGELCIRIACEDYDSIAQAMTLAGDDAEFRDRVATAIAMAHATHGRLAKAREMLESVGFPHHKIEVLITIDAASREMGAPPDQQTVH